MRARILLALVLLCRAADGAAAANASGRHWRLSIDSTPGQGASFIARFPLVADQNP